MNDVILNKQPKLLTNNLMEENHAIISPKNERYNIPLRLQGVTSYLTTWKTTIEEFEKLPRIELTYMSPEWNPSLPSFYEQEDALMEDWGQMLNYDE